MLQAAARIADGQVPYRDFWWFYPPGQPLPARRALGAVRALAAAWRVLRVLCDAAVARAGVRAGAPGRRVAAAGARGVARRRAGDGVSERAAPVPADARAVPRLRCSCSSAARRWRARSRGWPRVWRIEFAAYLGLGVAAGVRVRPARGARARPRAALRRAAAAVAARRSTRRSCAAAGLGRLLGPAGPLPDRGLRRLPVAAVPAGLRRPAEHRLARRLPRATRPRTCCCSTCRWCWCSAWRARCSALALGFERERWCAGAAAVFAIGMAHYLVTRPDAFHTAPLAVMVAVLGRAGRIARRRGRAAAARRPSRSPAPRSPALARSPTPSSRGSTGAGSSCAPTAPSCACRWPTACACARAHASRSSGRWRYVRRDTPPGEPIYVGHPPLRPRHRPARRSSTCSPTGRTRPATTSPRREWSRRAPVQREIVRDLERHADPARGPLDRPGSARRRSPTGPASRAA